MYAHGYSGRGGVIGGGEASGAHIYMVLGATRLIRAVYYPRTRVYERTPLAFVAGHRKGGNGTFFFLSLFSCFDAQHKESHKVTVDAGTAMNARAQSNRPADDSVHKESEDRRAVDDLSDLRWQERLD